MPNNDLVNRPSNCDIPMPQGFGKQEGWICPVCGRGLAPWVDCCPCQIDRNITRATGTGTGIYTNLDSKKFDKYATTDESEWIHLPCKVGDVVYQVTRNFISEFRVRFVEIATCGNLFLHTDLISGIVYTGDVFSESDIGKTVFLAREDAEKALKDMRKEDN